MPDSSESFINRAKELAKQIVIDYSRDSLLDKVGKDRLRDSYMMDGESSPQQRYAFVSAAFSSNPDHAQRLYDYASKQWFGYATPILSFGRNKRGLPISCFGTFVPDTSDGLIETWAETNRMSMLGGGVGIYFGTRGQDEKSVGLIPHAKTYDSSVLAYKQGTTRRGSYALYIDISHPEIVEFLSMRKVSGDNDRKCLNLHNAIVIPDSFMEIIERCMHDVDADDSWNLVDPVSKEVKATVSAKELWQTILELRAGAGRGEPYLMFSDTVNNAAPEVYKKNNLTINHSNLCLRGDTLIEIMDNGKVETCRIDDFVEKFNMGFYENVLVKSHRDGDVIYSQVTDGDITGVANDLIRIETESGRLIECTESHKIFTHNRGWVEAGKLIETDVLEVIG